MSEDEAVEVITAAQQHLILRGMWAAERMRQAQARLRAARQPRSTEEDPDDWAVRIGTALTGLITPKELHDIAAPLGDPVQGIRYGQPWQALVPPHARHLIATNRGGER